MSNRYLTGMKPHERLAEASAPDGTPLLLLRHDGHYVLRAAGAELMSTRRSNSEAALAEVACAAIAGKRAPEVLIGGLGFGFTLRSALERLGADASVMVAELIPEVIEWNLNPEWALGGAAMQDPRVTIREADVLEVLQERVRRFDAILLDVDNGAEAFTTRSNAALYDDDGIRTTLAALRPDGVLAYWAAGAEERFTKALQRAGLVVETIRSATYARSRNSHVILLARRAADLKGS